MHALLRTMWRSLRPKKSPPGCDGGSGCIGPVGWHRSTECHRPRHRRIWQVRRERGRLPSNTTCRLCLGRVSGHAGNASRNGIRTENNRRRSRTYRRCDSAMHRSSDTPRCRRNHRRCPSAASAREAAPYSETHRWRASFPSCWYRSNRAESSARECRSAPVPPPATSSRKSGRPCWPRSVRCVAMPPRRPETRCRPARLRSCFAPCASPPRAR